MTTNEIVLVDTTAGPVELLAGDAIHKYLGRAWSGDIAKRGIAAVRHRLGCTWGKFGTMQNTLLNRHISLQLRLKLFNSCITPAMLYAMETCPLTQSHLNKIDVSQRKMLRRIVGWVHVMGDEESWESVGHRMKVKLSRALASYPIRPWSELIAERKLALQEKLSSPAVSPLVQRVVSWFPPDCQHLNNHIAKVRVGHPRHEWHNFDHM